MEQYIENGWLDPTSDSLPPNKMIALALDRIKGGIHQYNLFRRMLGKLEGMDQLLEDLPGTNCEGRDYCMENSCYYTYHL